VFSRQIEALGREGDVLVAFTTSGGSKNILKAMAAARAKKMNIIVLTGEKGKHLAGQADVLVAVPSAETARIQEMHELIYHAWCEFVDVKICG
jgi:D-sedoheptulose 7-phosphate isomerase